MQSANTLLTIIRDRGKRGYLYRTWWIIRFHPCDRFGSPFYTEAGRMSALSLLCSLP
jgi:hypothetical protein